MYYLNCTRRADDGRIIERFKAPATHFFKLIADEAVYVDFDRFFIRAIDFIAKRAKRPLRGSWRRLRGFLEKWSRPKNGEVVNHHVDT